MLSGLDAIIFPDDTAPEADDGAAWWLVFDDDWEPVAYAGVYPYVDAEAPNTWFLLRAGVMPQARGNGLQRKLIKARVRYAVKQGCKRMITYTAGTNVPSMRSLIAEGFRPYYAALTTGPTEPPIFVWFERHL